MEKFKFDTSAPLDQELVRYTLYYLKYRGLSVDYIEEYYDDISKNFEEETGSIFLILDDNKEWFIEQVKRVYHGKYMTH
ncbi:MAG TPA: hypothetical protein VK153_00410 [Candidatus Paceibacterota bacterium]|nr:hypothetical protein [Candidatus Paceibacterota bacterium]